VKKFVLAAIIFLTSFNFCYANSNVNNGAENFKRQQLQEQQRRERQRREIVESQRQQAKERLQR